jgi:hypothetical protein
MTEPADRVRALLRLTADHLPGGPVTVPTLELVGAGPPPRRRRGLLLAAVSALVVAAAFAPAVALRGGPEPHPPAASAPTTVAPPPSAPAPATDCGTFVLGQRDDLPDAATRCFVAALEEKRPARLMVSVPTVEGDPIVFTYVGGRDGTVEVVMDTTQDDYGTKEVTTRTCTGLTTGRVFTFGHCTEPTPVTR